MKQCEQCYFINEKAYIVKIDGIKIQSLCNKCLKDKVVSLKERFGWIPEVYRNDWTKKQMMRFEIKKICEINFAE